MQLNEAFKALNLVQDFIPAGQLNRPGRPLSPSAITIHNTDNADRGANAAAHAKYLKGPDARRRKVSWHYTVDDESVYQSLPTNEIGWHAATGTGNASSIGIEICMHEGMDELAAYERAALLVAVLARQHGIAVPDGIVQHHHWSGKNCPSVLRARPNGWRGFLDDIQAAAGTLRETAAKTITPQDSHNGPVLLTAAPPAFGLGSDGIASEAAPVPADDPVPFASLPPGQFDAHWPIATSDPKAVVVSYETAAGTIIGGFARRFLAERANGTRHHVGVDLYCREGDEVVACADGRIVAFHFFYKRPVTDEATYALLIQHDGVVVNYGEVKAASPMIFNWKIGDKVTAGQPIARVSGTAMIHFETYRTGTRRTSPWYAGKPRPPSLLNPTRVLLALAATGIRPGPAGALRAGPRSALPGPAIMASRTAAPAVPLPGSASWHSKFEGEEWRYDVRGVYTRDRSGREKLWRMQGEPATCREIFRLYSPDILAAAAKHGVNPALIMMTIATETGFAQAVGFTGPRTFRWEGHVDNSDVTPPFQGTYSAGPMQCLATTVRDMLARHGVAYGLGYDPFRVAPAIRTKPSPAPQTHPLYEGKTNIDIGTGEIRMRWSRTGDDPILVAAAFNAGGLYPDPSSNWGLRAYRDHLDRAARWYGDACEVLVEQGIL